MDNWLTGASQELTCRVEVPVEALTAESPGRFGVDAAIIPFTRFISRLKSDKMFA
jgi:hypothetical protein